MIREGARLAWLETCSPASDAMCLRAPAPLLTETRPRVWFRNSYGVITDGAGWEIDRHTSDRCEECDPARPWSLWHHGEFVGDYATPAAAKADATPVDCSKCADLH